MDKVTETILALSVARGSDKSVRPSEIAREIDPENWQRLLGKVRATARRLAREGRIDILRKGRPTDPQHMRGVIRLRIKAETEHG